MPGFSSEREKRLEWLQNYVLQQVNAYHHDDNLETGEEEVFVAVSVLIGLLTQGLMQHQLSPSTEEITHHCLQAWNITQFWSEAEGLNLAQLMLRMSLGIQVLVIDGMHEPEAPRDHHLH